MKRNHHKNSTMLGRSILEMLGVLALIGLLTLGGLFGYQTAMNQYKANETIHDIMLRASNVPMKWENYQDYPEDEFLFPELGENQGRKSTLGYELLTLPTSDAEFADGFGYVYKVEAPTIPVAVCEKILKLEATDIDEIRVGASLSDNAIYTRGKYSLCQEEVNTATQTVQMGFYFEKICDTEEDCTTCQTCSNGLCKANYNLAGCGDNSCENSNNPCCGLTGKDLICCRNPECCNSTDPCCGSSDPCCGNEDPCCGSEDPCCGNEDPCCGSEDPCCGNENPCCGNEDPCCGNEDPCCGNEDPCCGSSDPCCGSSDPCCGSSDPCCGLTGTDLECCGSTDPCCGLTGVELACCKNSECCGSSDPCCGLTGLELNCCKNPECCDSTDPCCASTDPCCGSTDPTCGCTITTGASPSAVCETLDHCPLAFKDGCTTCTLASETYDTYKNKYSCIYICSIPICFAPCCMTCSRDSTGCIVGEIPEENCDASKCIECGLDQRAVPNYDSKGDSIGYMCCPIGTTDAVNNSCCPSGTKMYTFMSGEIINKCDNEVIEGTKTASCCANNPNNSYSFFSTCLEGNPICCPADRPLPDKETGSFCANGTCGQWEYACFAGKTVPMAYGGGFTRDEQGNVDTSRSEIIVYGFCANGYTAWDVYTPGIYERFCK